MRSLPAHPTCRYCPLNEGVHTVGIPGRLAVRGSTDTALVVIGEAPGSTEDRTGSCFTGQSGKLLDTWMACIKGPGSPTIYYTNTVRCRPPDNDTPPSSCINACRPHLEQELKIICARHEEVVLLAVGSTAAKALAGGSLTGNLRHQGRPVTIGGRDLPAFYTYHPAYTLPGRNPAARMAVADHLALLCRYLSGDRSATGEYLSLDEYTPILNPDCPSHKIDLLSIDIETYGIRSDLPDQTQFTPERSIRIDKVPRSQLIHTVSVAWRHNGSILHGAFYWANRTHRARLLSFITRAQSLLFKTARFDIPYLRAADPAFRAALHPFHKTLEDVDVWNYLDSDVRPEKSLKALAPLLGLPGYGGHGFHRYEDPADPDLLRYNTKDSVDTLKIRDILRSQIESSHGAGTIKLSLRTRAWYSDLLWSGILLSEAGIDYDLKGMLSYRRRLSSKARRLESYNGQPLCGTGSQSIVQALIDSAASECPAPVHRELRLTDKTKLISTDDSNLNVLLGGLPENSPHIAGIIQLQKLRSARKLLNSYLEPLVGSGPSRLLCTSRGDVGRANPTWFITPGSSNKEQDVISGTKQGRITAKDPAIQTLPRHFKRFLTVADRPGYLLSLDLSQVELRVASIISGDPKMLSEYQAGIDRHSLRAIEIFGDTITEHPDFRKTYRQVGKQGNFLIIYLGGPYQLRYTLRKEVGLETTLEFCERVVSGSRRSYPEYFTWADNFIEQASHTGYILEPILGQGRYVDRSCRSNRLSKSTLVNFTTQCIAAQMLLCAQVELQKWLDSAGLRSTISVNTYDALTLRGPVSELDECRTMSYNLMQDNWYIRAVFEHYGRSVPILAEHKESLYE